MIRLGILFVLFELLSVKVFGEEEQRAGFALFLFLVLCLFVAFFSLLDVFIKGLNIVVARGFHCRADLVDFFKARVRIPRALLRKLVHWKEAIGYKGRGISVSNQQGNLEVSLISTH
jgi:hypothetical protein